MRTRCCPLIIAFATLATTMACSNGVPVGPSDTSSAIPAQVSTPPPSTQPPPTTPTVAAAVAYIPDLQPIFATDCVPCHGGGRSVAARYSMTSYAGVMAAVTPRSASSALVIVTQPGGLMYAFLSGDRTSKAAMIRTWVMNGAPQTR